MDFLPSLKALFGATDFSARLEAFEKFDEQVQFCMWKQLRNRYSQDARPEDADALAAQVTKYLMGYDLDAVRQLAQPERRRELDACRHQVEGEADKLMQSDRLVNELVRRSLMTRFILYSCRYGSQWLDSAHGTNTEAHIRRYDASYGRIRADGAPDVPGHDDMDDYARCASEYVAKVDAAKKAR